MKRYFTTLIFLFVVLGIADAQYRKMSPLVREAAVEGKSLPAFSKGGASADGQRLVAFVQTTDHAALLSQGCGILLELGDIVIASIPLQNIEALAAMPEVQRIEARKSYDKILNDQAASLVFADKLWSPMGKPQTGLTGKDVVVGVVDAGMDYTHPTFRTADGQQLRIKAVWDWLDFTDGGTASSVFPELGRQYIGEEQIMQKKHSFDASEKNLQGHGTHTSATAAGSGFNGTTVSAYSGMAPEADLCLVSVRCSDNTSLIPEDKKYLFTSASNVLGFKYIFDYAESQGKPCVINISMGSAEDLCQSNLENDAISRLCGPGRIVCAAAGNEGRLGNYIHKEVGKEKAGAFLTASRKSASWLLSSTQHPKVNLTFYPNDADKFLWQYDTERLREFPDSEYIDTLNVNGKELYISLMAYPSWAKEGYTATDIIISSQEELGIGSSLPVALTLTDASNDIDAFAQVGSFTKNSKDATLADYDNTHCVSIPAACDDVIAVGFASFRASYINYRGHSAGWGSLTGGMRSDYSSIGPNKKENIKPEVMAPGQNIISAMNSYFLEALTASDGLRNYIVDTFQSNGRTYGWYGSSGTSMAAPVVTGVVALWLQENPQLTPDQVREVIMNTSIQNVSGITYPNNEYGYGLINAEAGVEYIRTHFTTSIQQQGIRTFVPSAENSIYTLDGQQLTNLNDRHGIFVITANGKTHKVVK